MRDHTITGKKPQRRAEPSVYRLEPVHMGPPNVSLVAATQLAGQLEDEEILRIVGPRETAPPIFAG